MDEYLRSLLRLLRKLPPEKLSATVDFVEFLLNHCEPPPPQVPKEPLSAQEADAEPRS